MKTCFILLLLLVVGTTTQAQQVNCDSATSQTEMNLCAAKAFNEADSAMNKVYAKLLAFLDTGIAQAGGEAADEAMYYVRIKSTLVLSQQRWLGMRDANATIPAQIYYMGEHRPLMVSNQRTIDTKDRLKFLEELLAELEGSEVI